jgi:hypothetical protein
MVRATGLVGWQRGYGFGGAATVAPTKDQQLAALRAQAESMEGALANIRSRLAEIEKDGE